MVDREAILFRQLRESSHKVPSQSVDIIILVNNSAGRKGKERRAHKAGDVFTRAGANTDVWAAGEGWEMNDLLKKAKKKNDLILIFGGDGSLNHAINSEGEQVPFGILAGGKRNVAAAGLGLPLRDIVLAAQMLLHGSLQKIDLISVQAGDKKRHALANSGYGLDGSVIYETEQANKHSLPAYGREIWRQKNFPPHKMSVIEEDTGRELPLINSIQLIVNNLGDYGRMLRFTKSKFQDGKIERIIIPHNYTVYDAFRRIVPHALLRYYLNLEPDLQYSETVKGFTLVDKDGRPIKSHTDGEGTHFESSEYKISVVEGGLTMVVPAGVDSLDGDR